MSVPFCWKSIDNGLFKKPQVCKVYTALVGKAQQQNWSQILRLYNFVGISEQN